jgi:hypothetical protein
MTYSPIYVPLLTLTLPCAAFAQTTAPPSGSFGFRLNNPLDPQSTDGGTAILGVMNFDGAGNVAGSFTSVGDGIDPTRTLISTGSLSGTYAVNPDGSGIARLQ